MLEICSLSGIDHNEFGSKTEDVIMSFKDCIQDFEISSHACGVLEKILSEYLLREESLQIHQIAVKGRIFAIFQFFRSSTTQMEDPEARCVQESQFAMILDSMKEVNLCQLFLEVFCFSFPEKDQNWRDYGDISSLFD